MADRLCLVSPAEADPGAACPSPDACGWPRLCLPGRCIAAETASSPNFSVFASWRRCELALAPHCPPELTLLRGLPDEWTEPPDRLPPARRPRHWARGGSVLAVPAWALACWAALGAAAWVLHWLVFR